MIRENQNRNLHMCVPPGLGPERTDRPATLSPMPRRAAIFGVLALAACSVGPGTRAPATPEEELSLRAKDLQRSMQQAALAGFLGSGGVYVLGGPRGPAAGLAIVGAIPMGITTGTYVGYLQQKYASNEERREKLQADIGQTNAEAEAALQTMRVVAARQQARLTSAKASGSPERISEAAEIGEDIQQDVNAATIGLINRLREIRIAARSVSPPGLDIGVDASQDETEALVNEMERFSPPDLPE